MFKARQPLLPKHLLLCEGFGKAARKGSPGNRTGLFQGPSELCGGLRGHSGQDTMPQQPCVQRLPEMWTLNPAQSSSPDYFAVRLVCCLYGHLTAPAHCVLERPVFLH